METHRVMFWRDLPGLEVARVECSTHVFPRHYHDELYAIGLMDQGASYCKGPEDNDTLVAKGQACLINPGQLHSGVPLPRQRISYFMLYIQARKMNEMAVDLTSSKRGWPEFTSMICTRPDLVNHLYTLVQALLGRCDALATQSALVGAIGNLLCVHGGLRSPQGSVAPGAIKRAREMLGADLERKILLEEVAQEVGLSQYHFLRQFKRQTGLSPHVFRIQRRIEKARDLLRQQRPLAEIAAETGFVDQSHFANTFKHFIGATPGQYMIRHQRFVTGK